MGRPRLGAALLAAGSSRRFGEADKLCAPYKGRMLAEHAARAIPVEAFENAWVIAAAPGHPCEGTWRQHGFLPLINPDAALGMGTSLALAARAAMEASLDGLLIALADMPLVQGSHFEALIRGYDGPEAIAVSAIGEVRMPPAIFGKAYFEALANASADTGARGLLGAGRVAHCPEEWLKDIDTTSDL
ncbi:MAG: nucleotidyltransferase family protein [Erythrobacter sp.]|uniref:nucleotidyltransferase family protein n=1 Tax=Erythrobacter sp. TaxID=1042 RepID=UPI003265CE46